MPAALFALLCCASTLTSQAQSPLAGEERAALQAHSLSGTPLYPLQLDVERRGELELNLEQARAALADNPDAPDNMIWVGRRLAYLGRYREAIATYTRGLERWPDSYKLYRHRGHRWISVREFDKAIADLESAARLIEGVADEVEPDGAPNAHNIPRSTSHSNIWYHLGLAYYLQGDFDNALRCYNECLEFCANDDMLVATLDWKYMTLRRLGRSEEAAQLLVPVSSEMQILENTSYLRRLLMYKGELAPEALLAPADASDLDLATQGYGVANWYLYNGNETRAKEIFARVLEGAYWPAFGFIAAEADMQRLR